MARRNVEAEEHAMDAQFHVAHTIWQTDLYDSVQDARSEARYTDDPQAEPTTGEVKDAAYICQVDESAGLRDRISGMRDV